MGEDLPSSHEIKLGYETDLIDKYLQSDFGLKVKVDQLFFSGEDGFFGLPEMEVEECFCFGANRPQSGHFRGKADHYIDKDGWVTCCAKSGLAKNS